MSINEDKILVTGGSGMIGYSLKWGYVYGNSIPNAKFVASKDYDLRDPSQVDAMMSKYSPDAIIHLAAKVGGVKANMENLGDFFRDNVLINTNVLEYSRKHNVKKVVSVLSTCIYPDSVSYPLTEADIHSGPPHKSNYAYAYAKRMLDVQSRAYREQYGCNFITAVANNLYGENDFYDLENSHVIPAITRKMYEAKLNKENVTLWGAGTPLREFTYSGDMAELLLFLLDNYDGADPINVGNVQEVSIKDVAEMISEFIGFDQKIIWDTSKPEGQYRKPSSNKNLIDSGWSQNQYTPLREGLKKTCDWFLENYPEIRGY
jgi:GDP-L-fucose synthase